MRQLARSLPIVLAALLTATPAVRASPALPPPTPIGVYDAFPPAPIVGTINGGPAGDPIGVSVLGFGRISLPPDTSFELIGPQVLAVAVGFPIATLVAGDATIGRLPNAAGDPGPDELAVGRRARLGPGDWLFVGAGSTALIETDGADDVVLFTAVVR